METKKNLRATPQEVPEKRPDLVAGIVTGSVWLRIGSGGVCIKPLRDWFIEEYVTYPLRAGSRMANCAGTVTYTGPIDDEMMANILIYG